MKQINSIYQKSSIYDSMFSKLEILENKIEGDLDAKFIVFYDNKDLDVLEVDQKQFLVKMIGAVKHNFENTLIINSATGIKFKQIVEKATANKIIFFGSTRASVGLNLNLKRYKIFTIKNIDCLFVDSLEILKDDKQRKGALWTLMKTMFEIS